MITRGKASIFKPKAYLARQLPESIVATLSQTVCRTTIKEEYQALIKNQIWTLVPLPPGRHFVGYKWIFKVKEKLDGIVERYKPRLVAKGFHQ